MITSGVGLMCGLFLLKKAVCKSQKHAHFLSTSEAKSLKDTTETQYGSPRITPSKANFEANKCSMIFSVPAIYWVAVSNIFISTLTWGNDSI